MGKSSISERLIAVVNALPLHEGMRVLEIGCGTGAAAREIVKRIGNGHVLAIDRSAKAIETARSLSYADIESGRLAYRQASIESFELPAGEDRYDLAFAVRVGALDGRHPAAGRLALPRIALALTPKGRLFIDGGDPIKEVSLHEFR